jgi:hypothetical protein
VKRGESAYADSPFTGEELRREELLVKNLWEIFPELMGSTFYQKFTKVRSDA